MMIMTRYLVIDSVRDTCTNYFLSTLILRELCLKKMQCYLHSVCNQIYLVFVFVTNNIYRCGRRMTFESYLANLRHRFLTIPTLNIFSWMPLIALLSHNKSIINNIPLLVTVVRNIISQIPNMISGKYT